jgi:hypothetical protein
MHPSRSLIALLLVTAFGVTPFGCGGKIRPFDEDGVAFAEEAGSTGGQESASSGGGSSSSGGGHGSSGGSSSGSSRSGSSSSSSGGAASGGYTCGGVLCGDSEVCCVSTAMGGDATAGGEECTSASSCAGLALVCGDAAGCSGGDLCCIKFDLASALGGGAITGSSSCMAKCPTTTGNGQLCAMSSECPSGVMCEATGMGGSVCGGLSSLVGGL